jgi:hypothetical protein
MSSETQTVTKWAAPQHGVGVMVFATFIGTMMAATVLLAHNYQKLGWPGHSRRIVGAFSAVTAVQVFVAFHIPPDLISNLASHSLLAMVATYISLRALRRDEPWVCDVDRHGARSRVYGVATGAIANLCLSGLQAKIYMYAL